MISPIHSLVIPVSPVILVNSLVSLVMLVMHALYSPVYVLCFMKKIFKKKAELKSKLSFSNFIFYYFICFSLWCNIFFVLYFIFSISKLSMIVWPNVVDSDWHFNNLYMTLLMTTAQVVETTVTVNNSPIQNYIHPDDHTQLTYEMAHGLKHFIV